MSLKLSERSMEAPDEFYLSGETEVYDDPMEIDDESIEIDDPMEIDDESFIDSNESISCKSEISDREMEPSDDIWIEDNKITYYEDVIMYYEDIQINISIFGRTSEETSGETLEEKLTYKNYGRLIVA